MVSGAFVTLSDENKLMRFKLSIIVICKKWASTQEVVNDILKLEDPEIEFELVVGEGDNPSEQRNTLAKRAKGDWLLFLDDDSKPSTDLLKNYNSILSTKEVDVVGGPSILEYSSDTMGQLTSIFFSSWVGIGPFQSRYNSIGKIRNTNEKELILCNLLIRKDYFLKQGGFNQNIYPNEENEFIKRSLDHRKIFYHPHAIVIRPPRKNYLDFIEQLFSYGKGRSKTIYLRPATSDLFFLIPLIFTFYVVLLPIILVTNPTFGVIPLIFYTLTIATSVIFNDKNKKNVYIIKAPLFFLIGHLAYGTGLIFGVWNYFVLKKSIKKNGLTFFQCYYPKKLD